MEYINKQHTAIVSILLFSIGLMLSCNSFAASGQKATQAALEAEIATREAVDTDLQQQIDILNDLLYPTTIQDETVFLKICKGSNIPQWEPCPYSIGDIGPAGGIVFYITDGGLHGLESTPSDQGHAEWGCWGTEISGADGLAVGDGRQNTVDILAGCSEAGIAAELADNYSLNGYIDWFLPSRDELDALCSQKDIVGGFEHAFYWSSSEGTDYGWTAWFETFPGCFEHVPVTDKDRPMYVRAIRAF